MAYIWINPVVASMYEPEILNDFLYKYGYKRFEATEDWLSVVRDKYRFATEKSEKTVIDMRCPKIKELVEEWGGNDRVLIPDIHPILIHCGLEGSRRKDLEEEEKIITTPCQALADMGNNLKLENTWFVPWNRFLESIGDEPEGVSPKESPIPPGFFEELGIKTISVTGEEKIRNYFKNFNPEGARLVELLFCKEGCHNGDGIRKCES